MQFKLSSNESYLIIIQFFLTKPKTRKKNLSEFDLVQ